LFYFPSSQPSPFGEGAKQVNYLSLVKALSCWRGLGEEIEK